MDGVPINKERILYLRALYGLSEDEFLRAISGGLKRPLAWGDVYRDAIPLHVLKRVDRVFQKGLLYYSDPATPERLAGRSVFFRRTELGSALSLGAKRRVMEFEDLKIRLNTLARLSDTPLARRLPVLDVSMDPMREAYALRERLLPAFTPGKRDFLKRFINRLGDSNIFVFEFVDLPNRREKANIDGIYLHPNAIVLKRRQDALSREIFTLAHELGHYLLDREEVEEVDDSVLLDREVSDVERWCNAFAFHPLLGEGNAERLYSVGRCDAGNAFAQVMVDGIAARTHLSRLAIYTELLIRGRMSHASYQAARGEMEARWELRQKEREAQRARDRANGQAPHGRAPKPIVAELVKDVYSIALAEGVVGEPEYCRALRVKPASAETPKEL